MCPQNRVRPCSSHELGMSISLKLINWKIDKLKSRPSVDEEEDKNVQIWRAIHKKACSILVLGRQPTLFPLKKEHSQLLP